MSQRVVGYTGEGRARRPVYALEEPRVARVTGYVVNVARHGMAVITGELVVGDHGPIEQARISQRAYSARQREAEGS